MKTLQLPLTRQWFEMTKSGVKTEDYREITPYWCNRLCLVEGAEQTTKFWEQVFEKFEDFRPPKLEMFARLNIEFKQFDTNKMTLGYPKSTDTERIINLEHKGIEIGYGNTEWGAEPNKLYFIIKHGKELKIKQ